MVASMSIEQKGALVFERGPDITIKELLEKATGRTILVGETHIDRESLKRTLELIREAHEAGYRVLGVETSEQGVQWGEKHLPGLQEELDYIRSVGDGALDEYDELSYVGEADAEGRRKRMNRQFQSQLAMRLGWRVVAVDPNHWNWMQQTEEGYLGSREPAMIKTVREGAPMIAVFGADHLGGLHGPLGEDNFVFVNAHSDIQLPEHHKLDEVGIERRRFTSQLPQLML